jgi:[acyl-carrier-protein] S-malonyltransferase
MEPAVEPFRAALDDTRLHEPAFTVFSSLTTQPFEDVRDELTKVLTRPVRWRETVLAMHEAGGRRFVEVGPGKVLARLGKRILPDCRVETPAEELAHA